MIRTLSCVVAAVALACCVRPVAAQPGAMEPSEAHKQIAREAGEWEAETTFWMAPDAEPMVSAAHETCDMLGDYWMTYRFEGEVAGQKFTGHSVLGYDPVAKKYVGTWCDTMTPFMSTMEGDYDVETHTLTMMGQSRDPASGEISVSKNVSTFIDENTKTFDMYGPVPGEEGQWWKMLHIDYKRVDK